MSAGNANTRLDQALETVDESRREALHTLVKAALFTAPVIASFSVEGLIVNPAAAQDATWSGCEEYPKKEICAQ